MHCFELEKVVRAVSQVLCSTLDTARRDERDIRDKHVTTSATGAIRNLVCGVISVEL